MNRRKFLGMLAAAPVVAKAAPLLKLLPPVPAPVCATISQFEDYASFSSLAHETAIDEVVQDCAAELGFRMGATLDALVYQTLNA